MNKKNKKLDNAENERKRAIFILRMLTLSMILFGILILLFGLNKFAPFFPARKDIHPIIFMGPSVFAIIMGFGLLIFSYIPRKWIKKVNNQ